MAALGTGARSGALGVASGGGGATGGGPAGGGRRGGLLPPGRRGGAGGEDEGERARHEREGDPAQGSARPGVGARSPRGAARAREDALRESLRIDLVGRERIERAHEGLDRRELVTARGAARDVVAHERGAPRVELPPRVAFELGLDPLAALSG